MRSRSNLLVLLGIAFFVVGGVIVYLITSDDDDGGSGDAEQRPGGRRHHRHHRRRARRRPDRGEQARRPMEVDASQLVAGAIGSLNQLAGRHLHPGLRGRPADHAAPASSCSQPAPSDPRGLRRRRRAARLRARRRRLREPRRPHQPVRRRVGGTRAELRAHQRRGARRRPHDPAPARHRHRPGHRPAPRARVGDGGHLPARPPARRRREGRLPHRVRGPLRLARPRRGAARRPHPGPRRRARSSKKSPTPPSTARRSRWLHPRSSSSTAARRSPSSSAWRWPTISARSPRSCRAPAWARWPRSSRARVRSTCSSPGPSLGTRSGLARLRLIREELPGMSLVLAFSRRPDASLRDIVRTGAVDLLQLPIDDKELAEAVERGIELAGAAPAAAPRRSARRPPPPARRRPAARPRCTRSRRPPAAAARPSTPPTSPTSSPATRSKRVCIVDLDLQFGEVSTALRLRPKYTIFDALQREDTDEADLRAHIEEYMRPARDRRQRARRAPGARPRPTASARPT